MERRPERGWRYAEDREGRGVRAISNTDLAAMLIASSRLISAQRAVTARRSRQVLGKGSTVVVGVQSRERSSDEHERDDQGEPTPTP